VSKGFSIIEVLVAMFILSIVALGVAGLITMFGFYTKDRILLSCLVEGAASGIEACKSGINSTNNIKCGGYTIYIDIQGECPPASGQCSIVNTTASANGKSFSLTDKICNFHFQ
jgi:prepilin-type N-terminal cleavage/methylation domain-containing protein